MKLFTSNFKICGKHPKAVSISAGVPCAYAGRRFYELAPLWRWIKLPQDEYTKLYNARLARLNPHDVAEALGEGAIMLCWERPGAFCHRQLVASWLREAGYDVTEWEETP